MTTRISQYLGGHIANWLRGTAMPSAPATVYMALSTATVSDSGSMVEATGVGYARQPITFSTQSQSEGSGTVITNAAPIVFTGLAAQVVTDFAVFDALTGGNLLYFGKLKVPTAVALGGSISFGNGVHVFQYGGLASYYFGGVVCGWIMGVNAPTAPTSLSLVHSVTPILRSGAGLTEPSGGYNRQVLTFGSPTFTTGVGTSIANTNNAIFGPATSTWTAISHAAIITNTNAIIVAGSIAVPFTVTPGGGRGVNAGAFDITVR